MDLNMRKANYTQSYFSEIAEMDLFSNCQRSVEESIAPFIQHRPFVQRELTYNPIGPQEFFIEDDSAEQLSGIYGLQEHDNEQADGHINSGEKRFPRYFILQNPRINKAVVKVSRFNTETTWNELKNLARLWGPTYRIHVARDRFTKRGRGFGFIHYKHRNDAARAIAGMNGLLFGGAILEAGWSRQSINIIQI